MHTRDKKARPTWKDQLRSHRRVLVVGIGVLLVGIVVWWRCAPNPRKAYRVFAQAFQKGDYEALYGTFSPGDRRFLTLESHRRMIKSWRAYLPQRVERWRLIRVERDPEPTVVDFVVEVEVLSQQGQTVELTLWVPVRRSKEAGRWAPWHVSALAFYGGYFKTAYGNQGLAYFNKQYQHYVPTFRRN